MANERVKRVKNGLKWKEKERKKQLGSSLFWSDIKVIILIYIYKGECSILSN